MTDRLQWQETVGPEAAPANSGTDVWGMLLRRKWAILFAVAVGAGLGYLYFTRQPSVYQATAHLLVDKERRPELPIQGLDGFRGHEENLTTHMLLIRSPLIVGRAVETHQLGSLRSFGRSPTGTIIGGLSVRQAAEKANVLELTFRGGDPDGIAVRRATPSGWRSSSGLAAASDIELNQEPDILGRRPRSRATLPATTSSPMPRPCR
jgi:hypothetical protein